MNKGKANEWLKIVTGKKIRRSRWHIDKYCIPTGEREGNGTFWAINENGKKHWYFIYEGFEESKYGSKWELVETFEDYLEMYHND